jgi:hypothetical protein
MTDPTLISFELPVNVSDKFGLHEAKHAHFYLNLTRQTLTVSIPFEGRDGKHHKEYAYQLTPALAADDCPPGEERRHPLRDC